MKWKLFITTFVFLISKLLGQTDSSKYYGLYLDGYKVLRMECCNFKKLQIVLPYEKKMDTVVFFNIWIKYKEPNKLSVIDSGFCFLPAPYFKKNVKRNYIIFTVFDNSANSSEIVKGLPILFSNKTPDSLTRQMFCESFKKSKAMLLSFWVEQVRLVEKGKGNFDYSMDGKYGIKINPLSKVYKYICHYSFDVECEIPKNGLKITDLN